MARFRIVKIFEADSIEDVCKVEKKHKAIKIEELDEDEVEEYKIGFHAGGK